MIISRGRSYIFVHIPKTGGTAMALALEERAMADDILIGDTPKAVKRRPRVKKLQAKGRLWKHSTLADIDGIVSPKDMNAMLLFTLVRNPWDRLVSYYHWLKAQTFAHPAVQLAAGKDFSGFLMHPHTQTSIRSSPARLYMTDARGHEHAAQYIRLEHLETDLAPLEAHLGFQLSLPHENRSERQADFRSYYSDETHAIVSRICAEDIKRFDYSFE